MDNLLSLKEGCFVFFGLVIFTVCNSCSLKRHTRLIPAGLLVQYIPLINAGIPNVSQLSLALSYIIFVTVCSK